MLTKAVIFDLDGTILENDSEYQQAFQEIFDSLGEKKGVSLSLVGGIGVIAEWDTLKKNFKLKTRKSSEELGVLTQQKYLIKLDRVTLKEGFVDFCERLREEGIKVALATSNNWSVVDEVLKKFKLENTFDMVTTAEEVKYQKPSGDIFRITAEKLNLDPAACLVVEDSLSGINAAHDAGMKVVVVVSSEAQKENLKGADTLIEDYSKLTL